MSTLHNYSMHCECDRCIAHAKDLHAKWRANAGEPGYPATLTTLEQRFILQESPKK